MLSLPDSEVEEGECGVGRSLLGERRGPVDVRVVDVGEGPLKSDVGGGVFGVLATSGEV